MRELEEKFNKPHPALEGFKEPHKSMYWLVGAFFRLHKRRQTGEAGYQPLMVRDLTEFADSVLGLDKGLRGLFFRTMEETDNVVLFDYYDRARKDLEASKSEADRNKPRRPKRGKR